jgi:hypothetical protein
MGALSNGQYRVQSNTVIIVQPSVPEVSLDAKVAGNQLTLGTRVDVRPESDLRATLDKACQAGTTSWERQALQR